MSHNTYSHWYQTIQVFRPRNAFKMELSLRINLTYRNHSMASNSATPSAGLPIDVKIMMIVTMPALGTDGIAIEAILVRRLQK